MLGGKEYQCLHKMWPRMGSGTPSSVSALTRDVQGMPASAPSPHTTLSLSSELQAGDPQAQRLTTQQAHEDAERLEAAGALPIRRFARSNSAHFAANSLRLGGNSLQFGEQAMALGSALVGVLCVKSELC